MSEEKTKQPISISSFLKDHWLWIFSTLTFIGVLLSNFIKLIDFIKNKCYFEKYGLNIRFYQYEEKGLLYEAAYSILIFLTIIIAILCIYKIQKRKDKGPKIIPIFLYFLILNVLIVVATIRSIVPLTILIGLIVMIPVEYFVLSIHQKLEKNEDKEFEENTNDHIKEDLIKSAILLYSGIIVMILAVSICPVIISSFNTEYKMIDHKAIVYTTKDYYLTLDSEVVGDTLVIYKGTETKISTENIQSKLVQYKKILIK